MNQIQAVKAIDAESIIVKALEQNVPVETLERLLAMREKIKSEQAKESYYIAMSEFQSDLPPIKKTREVKNKDGKVRYSYASLDDIIQQVSPFLKRYGLSFTVRTEHKEGFMIATCETHHIAGHSGESSFPVPIEKEGFMNDAQKAASAQTYAKRYAFCNAFGIVTGDYDDDAQSVGEAVSAKDIYEKAKRHADAVRANWDSITKIREGIAVNNLDVAAEAWEEMDNDTKTELWLSTTKGGIFTTEERRIIHSDEFSQLRRSFAKPENAQGVQ